MADAKTRATEYVEAEHHREHTALKASHQKWELHELNYHRGRINSIKENEGVINDRFMARMQTIDNKKANMAKIIDRQHKSLAGRLERLTPGGRARQEATWQRLDERADSLRFRAGQKHHMQLEKHYQHLQHERSTGNQNWMGYRGMNRDALVDHKRHHIEHRPNKIHSRMREMEQARIVQLRPELKHQFQQQANKPPSKTVQNNPMRENLKREFRHQANQPPSQTIQHKR